MRKILAVIPTVVFAAALFAQAPSAPKAKAKTTSEARVTPRPAGEFVINMTDGSQKLLSSYRGKTVVLAFMYTTCTHCQHTAGVLAKIQTEYASKGVQVLGVTFDPGAKAGVATFIKITGANFPCGYSTEDLVKKFMHIGDSYNVPMLAFIDRAGVVRFQNVVVNPGDDDPATLFIENQEVTVRKEIDKLLNASSSAAAKQAPKS